MDPIKKRRAGHSLERQIGVVHIREAKLRLPFCFASYRYIVFRGCYSACSSEASERIAFIASSPTGFLSFGTDRDLVMRDVCSCNGHLASQSASQEHTVKKMYHNSYEKKMKVGLHQEAIKRTFLQKFQNGYVLPPFQGTRFLKLFLF